MVHVDVKNGGAAITRHHRLPRSQRNQNVDAGSSWLRCILGGCAERASTWIAVAVR
jgi:hypothetical protein